MFSKSVINLASELRQRAPRLWGRPWSLALRMALWYCLSTFLLLLLITLLLYWALKAHLQQADDSRLLTKLTEVRRIIVTEPLDPERLKEAVQLELEYEARQSEPVLIRVKDSSGKVLVETPGMDKALPVGSFQDTWLALDKTTDGFDLTSSRDWPYRVMTAEIWDS